MQKIYKLSAILFVLLITVGAGCTPSETPTQEKAAMKEVEVKLELDSDSETKIIAEEEKIEVEMVKEEEKIKDEIVKEEMVKKEQKIEVEMVKEKIEKKSETTEVIPEEIKTETKEFNITAKKWQFEPSVITVNKGDKVRLVVKSIDVSHGLIISEFGINQELEPGETKIIEFTADKIGTFSFFCSVYCGSGHGEMKGSLIVK